MLHDGLERHDVMQRHLAPCADEVAKQLGDLMLEGKWVEEGDLLIKATS